MGEIDLSPEPIEARIAARLRSLRLEAGWSLDELAARCGVSRSTLSRIENGQTSPAAGQLGRVCAAFGITLSRLMALAEDTFRPLVRRAEQAAWRDPQCAYHRRIVSPPDPRLAGEAVRV
ncbi:MAG: helix-turn-helix transcriptional regulator, partial [Rhizobiaceae bacterium]